MIVVFIYFISFFPPAPDTEILISIGVLDLVRCVCVCLERREKEEKKKEKRMSCIADIHVYGLCSNIVNCVSV